jgi:hypothetical protein
MYPMVRPMFCRPMHPPMPFPQQFCRFRPNYSMGGLIPLGPYAMPPMFHTAGEPIKREYFEVTEESNQSIQEIENSDMESQIHCYRQKINRTQSADIGLLSSLLPPMHNPSTEVTQVFQTEDQLIGQNSGMTSEVTKMVNAVVEQQLVLPQFQEEGDEQHLIDIQSEVEVISQPNDIQEVK